MGLKNWQGQGPNYVPAYQASGTPFVTSSDGNNVDDMPRRISFPYVTRFFQVTNTGARPLRVGFSENGIQGAGGSVSGSAYERLGKSKNYIVISGSAGDGTTTATGGTVRLELRCKELWVMADGSDNTGFSLVAGLTGIHHTQFPNLTGSNGFQGVG